MLLSAVSVLVAAQSNSEIPEALMNNPVLYNIYFHANSHIKTRPKHKENTQQVCTRLAIIGRSLCCVVWELNCASCDETRASFGAKDLNDPTAICLMYDNYKQKDYII